jgi:hypothetical protein
VGVRGFIEDGESMRIRLPNNYKFSRAVFSIVSFLWWKMLHRGIIFDKVLGANYKNFAIDEYYLIRLK